MGISSNQARFLALTSRQVDLEHRIQQICQRRLRLASELENTATSYNNKISNRQLYAMNTANSGVSNIGCTTSGGYTTLTDASGSAILDSNGKSYYLAGLKGVTSASALPAYGITGFQANSTDAFKQSDGTVITYTDLGLTSSASLSSCIDAALRYGFITLASAADSFTQNPKPIVTGDPNMQLHDWRTVPALADELYKSDDTDAETKYDQTISEINAQDKKLQLEQTSIEVEYKAITSEKDSVKKVLDTNAQASFKYFS